MVHMKGEDHVMDTICWPAHVRDLHRQEAGKVELSIAAQIDLWLGESRSHGEWRRRTKELLKTLIPTVSEYCCDGGFTGLAAEGEGPVALRNAETVMIVADEISSALSVACERIRGRGLHPLILLAGPAAACHPSRANTCEAELPFDVLDLNQFVATMAFKRAWQLPKREEEMLADIIGAYGLRPVSFPACSSNVPK